MSESGKNFLIAIAIIVLGAMGVAFLIGLDALKTEPTATVVVSTHTEQAGLLLRLEPEKSGWILTAKTDVDGKARFENVPRQTKWEIINHAEGYEYVPVKSGASSKAVIIELEEDTAVAHVSFPLKEVEKEEIVTVSGFIRAIVVTRKLDGKLENFSNIQIGKFGEKTTVGWVPKSYQQTGDESLNQLKKGTIAIVIGKALTEDNYLETEAEPIHVESDNSYDLLMQELILVFPDDSIEVINFGE